MTLQNRRSMSSMSHARRGGRAPVLGSPDVVDVDAVEQHAQLRGVQGDAAGALADARQTEAAALEALVVDDEAASVPEQDLDPVAAAAHEDEQMSRERVHAPLVADDRVETVVAAAQVHRLGRQVDVDTRRQRQHRLRSNVTSSATYAGPSPPRTRRSASPTASSMTVSSSVAPAGATRTGSNRVALRATLPRAEPSRKR